MITTAILFMVFAVLWTLAQLIMIFPDVTVTTGVSGAIANAITYLASLDKFLPIDTMFIVIGMIMGIEIILAGYKVIMWVIRRIPTQS